LSTRDPLIVKELKDANISTIPTYLVLAPDSAHKDSPLADIKVRQAIAYAIDSNTIQNSFGAGLFKLSNQLVDKSTVYYNSNINAYPYNLQKAKEVLATSRFPSGFTLDIIYPNTFSCDTQLTAVQSMLSKINIQVNLKSLAGGAVVQARTDGWQNGFLVLALGIAPEKDPGRQLQILFSKDQAASGLFAVTARSEKYDSLLSSIIQEPDFDKRNALDKQLLKQMIDGDCMILSVYNNGWIYPKVANLKDAKIGEVWFHQWTPEDAWFSK
jgi:peptide/nickel transport system substrate-binding protein